MNTSSALQRLDRPVEFPYDLAGNSARTGRAKTVSSELSEPLSSSGYVSWIKFVARIADPIQHDLRLTAPTGYRLCNSNARDQLVFRGAYPNGRLEPKERRRTGERLGRVNV